MRDIIIVVVTLAGIFAGIHFYDDLIAAIGIQENTEAVTTLPDEPSAPPAEDATQADIQ